MADETPMDVVARVLRLRDHQGIEVVDAVTLAHEVQRLAEQVAVLDRSLAEVSRLAHDGGARQAAEVARLRAGIEAARYTNDHMGPGPVDEVLRALLAPATDEPLYDVFSRVMDARLGLAENYAALIAEGKACYTCRIAPRLAWALDAALAELAEVRAAWSRMPDAGFTDQDPRWQWWHETAKVRLGET